MGNQTTNLQHRQLENVSARDALIGEGGGDVTRLMAPPQPMANGPTMAQEGVRPCPAPTATAAAARHFLPLEGICKIEIEIN